ncbi:MAG: phospholipid carrier-dependent glycosyltransferase [Anaerolineae bacterium]|nr:phospholipid carrier-dependent glycosyltransferase [Anaerolineae bacterium]
MQSTPARPRYFLPGTVLILLVGFGLRLWELGTASFWYDEVLTETRAQASLDRMVTLLLEAANQTPLYFASLHLFPTGNELLLRFPSALTGVLGIALLVFAAVRLYGDCDLALLAGTLLACNPYHIWASRAARPYALLFVFALLSSYFFLLLLRGERSRATWIGFVLSSMAAYLTHYYAAGLPLAQYALFAFILRGNRGFFRRWLVAQFVAAIPVMIWVYKLAQQPTIALGISWIPRPGLDDILITLWNMTLGYDGSLPWYVLIGLAAAGIGLVIGLYVAFRDRATDRVTFYWFWLLVGPLVVAFIGSQFRPLYVDRYFMVFLPAVILLMVVGWQRLPRRAWLPALAGVVMLAGATNAVITIDHGEDVKEDWRRAAVYVAHEQQPGDVVVTETPVTLMCFLRYFDDPIARTWLVDGPAFAHELGPSVRQVWVVYRNLNEDGHRQGVLADSDPLESDTTTADWLRAHRDQIVSRREFNGLTVLLVNVEGEFAGTAN